MVGAEAADQLELPRNAVLDQAIAYGLPLAFHGVGAASALAALAVAPAYKIA